MNRRFRSFRWAPFLALAAVLSACGGPAPLPAPRPLVNFSGVRVNADPERMEVVDEFVRRAMENIERDPSFWIITQPQDSIVLPWEGLNVNQAADTAVVLLQRGAVDALTPYQIYAHMHLMARRGEVGEWIPEAMDTEGFELERVILGRIAEVWLYGRAIYDAAPYAPLDELLWSSQAGYLDAYIVTARGEEFPEARALLAATDERRLEEYQAWFRETFDTDPPGMRRSS
jgi:hypothetical protein